MRVEGRGKKKREEGGKEKKKRGEEEENLLLITLHCRPWSAFFIRIKLTHICTPLLKGASGCCALCSAGPFACIVPISPGTRATAPGSTCIVKITDTPSKSTLAFLCQDCAACTLRIAFFSTVSCDRPVHLGPLILL